ncbi:MAG: hypothetical protein FWH12_06505 [Treponema sp.]|nr:hypothetical protein [Treponema sp.]
MIKLDFSYSVYVDINHPNHPGGAAINTSSDNEEDGTPIFADLVNDLRGWMEAAIVDARKSFVVSGNTERPGASDVLDALKVIIARMIDNNVSPQMILSRLITVDGVGSGLDADLLGGYPPEYYLRSGATGFMVTHVSGPATVIPWPELNIEYVPTGTYAAIITAHGNYPDYISFPYEAKNDGLHVYPHRLENGKLVAGTGMKKWGIDKWGTGKTYVPGRKWGIGTWGSDKWSASRSVGGEAWGVYGPMPINIQVKEV